MLGPFRVVQQIGAGGMGAVYRGVHVATGEEVALKTVLVPHTNEHAAIRTEIQALRRLEHPSIVRIIETGVEGSSPWYAMELLQGCTLQEFVRRFWSEWRVSPADSEEGSGADAATMTQRTGASGPILFHGRVAAGAPVAAGKLREALTLAYRLCAPLAYLHQLGIVHRDLKPGNVFVRPDGRPVLMDFGLVSRFGATGRDVLEIAGTLAGTAAYMAPEQILRRRVDARTDLYALGCMLFELLTGRPPFLSASIGELLQQHLTEPAVPPSAVVTGVPASLDQLLLALLAKRARDRIGHADDVAAWLAELGAEVDAPAASGATYLYRPELAGRSEVLQTFERHLQRLLAGVGSCVLVGGESGVGKTSVVAELARDATLQHLVVVAGECQPPGGGVLHPLAPLIGRIIDRAVEGGIDDARRLFGVHARVFEAIEPGIARLPGYETMAAAEALPPDAARARLLNELRETVAAFTEERPVLLVLDDLQWADALTLQFLFTTGADFFERNALLVVGTFRSDEEGPLLRELLALPTIERLALGRLGAAAIGSMIGDMLAIGEPPPEFVEFVARHSEGNPFFVAEYLRLAVAEGLLRRAGGRWVFGARSSDDAVYTQLPVPASLRELVTRRLSGLPRDAQELARIAAVLGREVDGALLLAASAVPEGRAMEAIAALRSRQVLDLVEGGRYRFLHDKLREAAYAAIPEAQLPALHRRAAETIEAVYDQTGDLPRFYGSLASHFERAGDGGRAIEYLEKAAEHAKSAFADREVVDYLTSALRLDEAQGRRTDPQRRIAWRTDVGVALRGLGEIEKGRAELEASLSEQGHPVPTRSAIATARHVIRELVFRKSLRSPPVVPRPSNPEAERALHAYNYVAMIAYHQTDALAQIFCVFGGLKLAPLVGPSHQAAQLYGAAGNILGYLGLRRIAWRYTHIAHEIARVTGHGVALGLVNQLSGHLAAFQGDMQTFDRDIHRALETYTRIGHHRYREEALTNIAHLQGFRGQLAESFDTFREIERSGRARDDPQTIGWGALGQAKAAAMLGRTREALDRYVESVPKGRDDLSALEGFAGRALVLAQLDDTVQAREDIARVLAVMQKTRTTSYTSIWAYSAALEALFHLQPSSGRLVTEDVAVARALVSAFRRFVRIIKLARPRLQLWVGVLEWHLGQRRRARRAWHEAISGASRIGLPYDLALAHFWIGRCAEGDERRRHLAAALPAFERMQAQWHAAYARRLLDEFAS